MNLKQNNNNKTLIHANTNHYNEKEEKERMEDGKKADYEEWGDEKRA